MTHVVILTLLMSGEFCRDEDRVKGLFVGDGDIIDSEGNVEKVKQILFNL